MKTQDRILKAFWRRGRKCFVPLMGGEVERLAHPAATTEIRAALRDMVASGKAEKTKYGGNMLLYELTEDGRSDAMRLIGALA